MIARNNVGGFISGGIILADAACPSGYTRVTVVDGKFLVGGATYNAAAGGAASHTHADLATHNHSISFNTASTTPPEVGQSGGGASSQNSNAAHTHGISGTSTNGTVSVPSQTVDPSYATVILCKRTT